MSTAPGNLATYCIHFKGRGLSFDVEQVSGDFVGVIRRDELVFMKARERRIPIVMLTSGGYQRGNAVVIANSILNLYDLGLISGPATNTTVAPQRTLLGEASHENLIISPYMGRYSEILEKVRE